MPQGSKDPFERLHIRQIHHEHTPVQVHTPIYPVSRETPVLPHHRGTSETLNSGECSHLYPNPRYDDYKRE